MRQRLQEGGENFLDASMLEQVSSYNERLDRFRHATDAREPTHRDRRHPPPAASDYLSYGETSVQGTAATRDGVLGLYDLAAAALDTQCGPEWEAETDVACIGRCLVARRDIGAPHPRGVSGKDTERQIRARALHARTLERRRRAHDSLVSDGRLTPQLGDAQIRSLARSLRSENLTTVRPTLNKLLIHSFVDAHLSAHAIESRLSLPLIEHLRLKDAYVQDHRTPDPELRRCVVLNTFVFAAARAIPWVFAEDEREAKRMIDEYEQCWTHVVPSLAMWIPTQLSLLALHHRGRCYMLGGAREKAYKDFHKLHRLVRDAKRRLLRGTPHASGALEFLDGLAGLADYSTGELYRSDHAHVNARRRFERARARFDPFLDSPGEIRNVICNSRWYVELLLSHGKTAYELGRFHWSLNLYLRSWRSLLELAAGNTGTEARVDDVSDAIRRLDQTWLEPELNKPDVIRWVKPVVEQLPGVAIPPHLSALAADILLRLGHLLFVVRLGNDATQEDFDRANTPTGKPRTDQDVRIRPEDIRDGMAFMCLKRAAAYDPANTLIASDLLKIKHRRIVEPRESDAPDGSPWDGFADPLDPAGLLAQTPLAGEDFERVSRLIEYVNLRTLADDGVTSEPDDDDPAAQDRRVARDLLAGFYMHTDSVAVRKSQLHRYLLRRRRDPPPLEGKLPFLELVCVRRYGSLFPFLPRPSAFGVLGGGYLLRVYPESLDGQPFGIAIDPGSSFVENLYRCGYGIADLDMVVVTHDHPDHMASLEPLLSLLHHQQWMDRAFKRIPILANKSVTDRIAWVKRYPQSWNLVDLTNPGDALSGVVPDDLVVDWFESGHTDLGGHSALALRFGLGEDGPSAAFTSDVPQPDPSSDWRDRWRRMLESDVLTAHLSSVPIAELRQLARVQEPPPESPLREDYVAFEELWEAVRDANEGLYATLEYASWINQEDREPKELPIGPIRGTWLEAKPHLYLAGTLAFARAFAAATTAGSAGAFVIGELSEELGTFRTKVAEGFNRAVFQALNGGAGARAISADVGLKITVSGEPGIKARCGGNAVRVLCTTCDLDSDLIPDESYHDLQSIVEVCVKGENEGLFYNCTGHDPSQQDEPTFIERLERYDVFGR